jgi:hypothetical protein
VRTHKGKRICKDVSKATIKRVEWASISGVHFDSRSISNTPETLLVVAVSSGPFDVSRNLASAAFHVKSGRPARKGEHQKAWIPSLSFRCQSVTTPYYSIPPSQTGAYTSWSRRLTSDLGARHSFSPQTATSRQRTPNTYFTPLMHELKGLLARCL